LTPLAIVWSNSSTVNSGVILVRTTPLADAASPRDATLALSGHSQSTSTSRNIRIEEDLVDQLVNSSEKRLARVLLLLANFGKDGKPACDSEDQPGNAGRDRWYNSLKSQPLHEQIP